jgi:hypothetical protein
MELPSSLFWGHSDDDDDDVGGAAGGGGGGGGGNNDVGDINSDLGSNSNDSICSSNVDLFDIADMSPRRRGHTHIENEQSRQ